MDELRAELAGHAEFAEGSPEEVDLSNAFTRFGDIFTATVGSHQPNPGNSNGVVFVDGDID